MPCYLSREKKRMNQSGRGSWLGKCQTDEGRECQACSSVGTTLLRREKSSRQCCFDLGSAYVCGTWSEMFSHGSCKHAGCSDKTPIWAWPQSSPHMYYKTIPAYYATLLYTLVRSVVKPCLIRSSRSSGDPSCYELRQERPTQLASSRWSSLAPNSSPQTACHH